MTTRTEQPTKKFLVHSYGPTYYEGAVTVEARDSDEAWSKALDLFVKRGFQTHAWTVDSVPAGAQGGER